MTSSSPKTGPQLHPQDYFIKYTFNYIVPRSVRPNHITVARFLLTPVVIALLFTEQYLWGSVLFLITSFTDMLDGSIARLRDQITDWGKVFDPVADKFLIVSVILITIIRFIDLYLALAVIAFEIMFVLMGAIGKFQGREVQANVWGKIKMTLQVIAVCLVFAGLIAHLPALFMAAQIVFAAAILFAILSLVSFGI